MTLKALTVTGLNFGTARRPVLGRAVRRRRSAEQAEARPCKVFFLAVHPAGRSDLSACTVIHSAGQTELQPIRLQGRISLRAMARFFSPSRWPERSECDVRFRGRDGSELKDD
ncbi:hypothetical protein AOLI_G00104380 [Acnodon oligacanthus]